MKKFNDRGSAARDPHGIKQITVGPPHGIKQITMFIRENVECLDSSFTTTTTIKVNNYTYHCLAIWVVTAPHFPLTKRRCHIVISAVLSMRRLDYA
ncbi:hypothetical protein J6590_092797 [Homalodisca vitripennis]|nr:hypothetical protein J6590_092797 [Homalodisca vitripennis]